MKNAFLILLGFIGISAQATRWDSGIAAKATKPHPGVNGISFYTRISTNERHNAAFTNPNCVLLHGHGVTQDLLDTAFAPLEGQLPMAEIPADFPIPPGLLPSKLVERIQSFSELDSVSAFANFYFGEPLIKNLLRTSCGQIWVLVQETVQSSIFEMTLRTERFLKEVACREKCAVLGHSKSGAAITAALRRCGEKTSTLGEAGCRNLSEIYSASGVNEGVGVTLALIGAKKAQENEAAIAALARSLFNPTEALQESFRKVRLVNAVGGLFKIDILGDKLADTNPLWFDLGPLAEMEGGKPIAVVQGEGFVPQRIGWIANTEYTASGTSFRFDKVKYEGFTGPAGITNYRLQDPLAAFVSIGTLPTHERRPELLGGPIGEQLKKRFGFGDMAKLKALLDFWWEPYLYAQEFADVIMRTSMADLHGDPKMAIAYALGHAEVSAKSEALAVAMRRWSLFPDAKKPLINVAFNESDGLVEVGSALGACNRGKLVAPTLRIVDDCQVYDRLHHLGVTGVSHESQQHIQKAFSTRRSVRSF